MRRGVGRRGRRRVHLWVAAWTGDACHGHVERRVWECCEAVRERGRAKAFAAGIAVHDVAGE